jgi:hypothetical protein
MLNVPGGAMKERLLTVPEIMLIAGTRVALGIGIGLLIAHKLSRDTRKGAGCALLAVGVLSTVPIMANILGKSRN